MGLQPGALRVAALLSRSSSSSTSTPLSAARLGRRGCVGLSRDATRASAWHAVLACVLQLLTRVLTSDYLRVVGEEHGLLRHATPCAAAAATTTAAAAYAAAASRRARRDTVRAPQARTAAAAAALPEAAGFVDSDLVVASPQ
eukprot:scaffold8262_cov48-Phaeocystis_antarctica.AAC.1